MKVKDESGKVGLKLNIQKSKIMASCPITSQQIDGETVETVRLYFGGLQNHCNGYCSYEIKKKCLLLGRKIMSHVWHFVTLWTVAYQAPLSMGFSRQEYWSGLPFPSLMTNLDSIKKQRHYFSNKDPSSQGYGFSSSHVWMRELNYKQSWVPSY